MARWEPNARERLEKAAMELFVEKGYVETTVELIAARAGLTERTFFRYFSDKREVLFSGSKDLEEGIVTSIAGAPPEMGALDAVIAAFESAAAYLEGHREIPYVRARWALVSKHSEIQERELIKLATMTLSITKALHVRGVAEPEASIAAEAGMAVFKIGFQQWLSEKRPKDFPAHIRAAVTVLRAIMTAPKTETKKTRRSA